MFFNFEAFINPIFSHVGVESRSKRMIVMPVHASVPNRLCEQVNLFETAGNIAGTLFWKRSFDGIFSFCVLVSDRFISVSCRTE